MSLPDGPQDNTNLSANEPDLSDAERAALADKDTTAVVTPPAEEAVAAAADAVVDPSAAVAAEATAAAEAEAAAAAAAAVAAPPAAPQQPFVPTYQAGTTRDFTADIAAVDKQLLDLKAQYKSGAIDDDAYENQQELLRDQKSTLVLDQRTEQIKADLTQQNADQSWTYLQRQFLSAPENAAINSNGLLFAAWEQAMQDVVNEAAQGSRSLTDWDLMTGARQKLAEAGMMNAVAPKPAPAAAAASAELPAKPDRTPPLQNVPATLSSVPAAADPGSRTTADTLSENGNIEDIESWMASRSDADRDAILRQVPGAVVFDS